MANDNVRKDGEFYLNPKSVCMARRERCGDKTRYYIDTADGSILQVTEDDYYSIVAWIEVHE